MALPDKVQITQGTAIIWGEAGASGVTHTLSLDALANGEARMGTSADLGANYDDEYLVYLIAETGTVVEHLDLDIRRVGIVPVANGIDHGFTQGRQGIVPDLVALGLASDHKPDIDMLPEKIHRLLDLVDDRAPDHPVVDDVDLRAEASAVDSRLGKR